jgi:hypothetical protein
MPSAASYTDDEVLTFLDIVIETDSFKLIDGRQYRNQKVYDMLAGKVNENAKPEWGAPKNGEQWRVKYKALKTKYLAEKTGSSKSG